MINKKRQELIIQNLRSISSEVRMKSIQQLMQIPTIPAQEKIQHLQTVVNDSEPEVSNMAAQAVAQLSGQAEPAANAPPAPPAPEMPPSPPLVESPDSSVEPGLPAIDIETCEQSFVPSAAAPLSHLFEPPAPKAISSHSPMPPLEPPPEPPLAPAAPITPVASPPPEPLTVPVVSQPAPLTQHASPLPGLDEASLLPPSLSMDNVVGERFVDDPPDPTLPNIAKITSIPDLLAHIQELAHNRPPGHATQLLTLARSGIEEVALTALQALLNLKDSRFSSEILTMLGEDQFSSQRRFLMLKIILESDQPLHVPLIESILLKEKDVIVKSGLVKVYARSSGVAGVSTLIICLQDQDARVRANTVEVIEEQNIRGCEQKIVELLQDPENRVKVNAAKYLVKNGYQQAFTTLRSMLVSSEVWLRDSVIFALGEIGDQPSLTLLKAALKDPNQGIRLSVLKALARINNSIARQVLKAACGDPDPVVAQVSNTLLEKIKDTPIREDIRYIPNVVFETEPSAPQTAMPKLPEAPVQPSMPPAMPTSPLPSAVEIPPVDLSQPESSFVSPDAPPAVFAPVPPVQPVAPRQVKPAQPAEPETPLPEPIAASPVPAAPVLPEIPVSPPSVPPRPSIPGMPNFSRPRSEELYIKLCSSDAEVQKSGSRDIAFILGDDQILLLSKAVTLADESIRINAVKILSRKKTPDARALLEKLTSDQNETVRSLAEKALVMLK